MTMTNTLKSTWPVIWTWKYMIQVSKTNQLVHLPSDFGPWRTSKSKWGWSYLINSECWGKQASSRSQSLWDFFSSALRITGLNQTQIQKNTLVGGFNPFEKYARQIRIISPGRVEHENIWNHHLDTPLGIQRIPPWEENHLQKLTFHLFRGPWNWHTAIAPDKMWNPSGCSNQPATPPAHGNKMKIPTGCRILTTRGREIVFGCYVRYLDYSCKSTNYSW